MFPQGGGEAPPKEAYREAFSQPSGLTNTSEWVEWLRRERVLVPVGRRPDLVCAHCYGSVPQDWIVYRFCTLCRDSGRDLISGIVPIVYSHPGGLEKLLWQYKGTPAHPAQPWVATATSSLLFEFLHRHLACIEGRWGPRDVVTVVPSHTNVGRGFDHLKTMIDRVPELADLCHWDLSLLERVSATKIPKRTISETAYSVNAQAGSLAGRRVMLVDDTFTSGATLFSAATALRQAGADDIVAVTIGRQLATEWADGRAILADHMTREFDIARCVLGCP